MVTAELYKNKQGMALLITIMVVSLLIAVTIQFNRTVRQSFFSSATQLEGINLRAIAGSGLTLGAALLEVDGQANTFDTLVDVWADLGEDDFSGMFDRGSLHIDITDVSGKIQLGSLVQEAGSTTSGASGTNASENRDILKRLLLSGNFEIESEQEAQEIVDALTDWIDADDRESDFGAEDSYYQSLDPPYGSKNGPVADLEELLLVKGISSLILFGDETHPGLADYLTVHGTDGKININTAPEELLKALHPLMTDELVTVMNEYRQVEENLADLEKSKWYQNTPAWPGDIELPANIISTTSRFFRLRVEGRFSDQSWRETAVVERNDTGNVVFLSRRVE